MVMPYTGFWMIRHALVEENARAFLYGSTDVELCESTLVAQVPVYQALARMLPRPAHWACTPLSRTRRTAEAIFGAGYPRQDLQVVDALIEQSMGEWHGVPHGKVPEKLTQPAHPFWPLSGSERPPGGESMQDVIGRVGPALERLAEAHRGENVIAVSHGGTIRAALAHALGIAASNALHLSVQNVSLTKMERHPDGWKVVSVNEMPWF